MQYVHCAYFDLYRIIIIVHSAYQIIVVIDLEQIHVDFFLLYSKFLQHYKLFSFNIRCDTFSLLYSKTSLIKLC